MLWSNNSVALLACSIAARRREAARSEVSAAKPVGVTATGEKKARSKLTPRRAFYAAGPKKPFDSGDISPPIRWTDTALP